MIIIYTINCVSEPPIYVKVGYRASTEQLEYVSGPIMGHSLAKQGGGQVSE